MVNKCAQGAQAITYCIYIPLYFINFNSIHSNVI